MRGEPLVGNPDRQRATLARVAGAVTRAPWLDALLLVGSLASDTADALSDVDLLVVVREDHFEQAWADREALQVADPLCAWDQPPVGDTEVAAHR